MKKPLLFLFLFILFFTQMMVLADERAIIKDPFGSEKTIPIHQLNGVSYVSLYDFAEAGNFLYDFDRFTRKVILQNDQKLIQILPGSHTFSCNVELVYADMKPIIHNGGVYFPVTSLPLLMGRIGMEKYALILQKESESDSLADKGQSSALQNPKPRLSLADASQDREGSKNADEGKNSLVEVPSLPSVDSPRILDKQDASIKDSYRSSDHMLKYIILDPGHGGQDPGGVGVTGLREKIVVQKVSEMVKEILNEKIPDVEIVLTRTANHQYVSLSSRTAMANEMVKKSKYGLFVSIHANISRDGRASGYETFFLTKNPSDDSAREAAALENGYFEIERKDANVVSRLLSGMLDAELIRQSRMLAENITAGYQKNLPAGTLNRGVKSARFYVLEGVMMPSVLTEIGFLSNPREERLMKDDAYLRTVANAIADGIINFVLNYNKYKGFS
jgi:N-acetylmuramoyl-L-alanine amidase